MRLIKVLLFASDGKLRSVFFFEKISVNICGKKWLRTPPFPLLDLVDRDRGRRARRPGNPLDSLAAQLLTNRQDYMREEDLSGLERHPSWAAHPGSASWLSSGITIRSCGAGKEAWFTNGPEALAGNIILPVGSVSWVLKNAPRTKPTAMTTSPLKNEATLVAK